MKYREQCRQKEVLKNSGGAASGSSSQVKDEDDFGDDEEMIPSANPDDKEGAKDRVAKLNLHDIRSRIDNLTLGEQELNPEDEKWELSQLRYVYSLWGPYIISLIHSNSLNIPVSYQ